MKLVKILKRKVSLYRKKSEAIKKFPNLDKKIIKLFFKNFGYAAPLSLLDKLDKITKKIDNKCIVEFGSGVSTLAISKNISMNTKFATFDENIDYLIETQSYVKSHKNIFYIHSPPPDNSKFSYKNELLQRGIKLPVDLLIIDGPSGDRFTNSLKKIHSELISEKTICIVDDTDREINDQGTKKLAEQFNLIKIDYSDPIYTRHKYSILYPRFVDNKQFD